MRTYFSASRISSLVSSELPSAGTNMRLVFLFVTVIASYPAVDSESTSSGVCYRTVSKIEMRTVREVVYMKARKLIIFYKQKRKEIYRKVPVTVTSQTSSCCRGFTYNQLEGVCVVDCSVPYLRDSSCKHGCECTTTTPSTSRATTTVWRRPNTTSKVNMTALGSHERRTGVLADQPGDTRSHVMIPLTAGLVVAGVIVLVIVVVVTVHLKHRLIYRSHKISFSKDCAQLSGLPGTAFANNDYDNLPGLLGDERETLGATGGVNHAYSEADTLKASCLCDSDVCGGKMAPPCREQTTDWDDAKCVNLRTRVCQESRQTSNIYETFNPQPLPSPQQQRRDHPERTDSGRDKNQEKGTSRLLVVQQGPPTTDGYVPMLSSPVSEEACSYVKSDAHNTGPRPTIIYVNVSTNNQYKVKDDEYILATPQHEKPGSDYYSIPAPIAPQSQPPPKPCGDFATYDNPSSKPVYSNIAYSRPSADQNEFCSVSKYDN